MENNWHDRFWNMKRDLEITNEDISDIIGNTPDSVKSTTQRSKELPRWLKLVIVVWERMRTETDEMHSWEEVSTMPFDNGIIEFFDGKLEIIKGLDDSKSFSFANAEGFLIEILKKWNGKEMVIYKKEGAKTPSQSNKRLPKTSTQV